MDTQPALKQRQGAPISPSLRGEGVPEDMSTVAELWRCENEEIWRFALKTYWLFVKPQNRKLEEELESLGLAYVQNLNAEDWYNFLLDKYFR